MANKILKSVLLHAWTVYQKGDRYYLPYTHWIYLNEIVKYYDFVCLLSPVKKIKMDTNGKLTDICIFKNVSIYHLPYSEGYAQSIRYFFSYVKAYSQLKEYTTVYVRFPIPFGWLQKIYMKNSRRIIHFVGDPIDTILSNPQIKQWKKIVLCKLFLPEFWLFLWACKNADVYTNGYHITEKLNKHKIQTKPLVSSTLNSNDFYFDKNQRNLQAPAIIYIGYLRKAKGVDTVIYSFSLLKQKYPNAKLTIVGSGESENELKYIVKKEKILNVNFMGHIDERQKLNQLLRKHNLFCFASLSEGSPRVILEAMANGINIVSTPVGSLPYMFKDGENILFADFNKAQSFFDKMVVLLEKPKYAFTLRKNAFDLIQNYTIENFLKNIFHET